MKVTIEFKLPEERCEYLQSVHMGDAFCALDEIRNQLRTWTKHGHEFKTPEECLEAVVIMFYNAIESIPMELR